MPSASIARFGRDSIACGRVPYGELATVAGATCCAAGCCAAAPKSPPGVPKSDGVGVAAVVPNPPKAGVDAAGAAPPKPKLLNPGVVEPKAGVAPKAGVEEPNAPLAPKPVVAGLAPEGREEKGQMKALMGVFFGFNQHEKRVGWGQP